MWKASPQPYSKKKSVINVNSISQQSRRCCARRAPVAGPCLSPSRPSSSCRSAPRSFARRLLLGAELACVGFESCGFCVCGRFCRFRAAMLRARSFVRLAFREPARATAGRTQRRGGVLAALLRPRRAAARRQRIAPSAITGKSHMPQVICCTYSEPDRHKCRAFSS